MPAETPEPEFKFKVETLASDLEEKQVAEEVLKVEKKQLETEPFITKPDSSTSEVKEAAEKQPIIQEVILPEAQSIELTPEKPEYFYQPPASTWQQPSTSQLEPKLVPANPSKFKRLWRLWRKIKPVYLAPAVIVVLVIFGFVLIRNKLAKKPSTPAIQEISTSAAPIFVPPGSTPTPRPTPLPSVSTPTSVVQIPAQPQPLQSSLQSQPTQSPPTQLPTRPTATKTVVITVSPDVRIIVATTATSIKVTLPTKKTTLTTTPSPQTKTFQQSTKEESLSPKITTKIEGSQTEVIPVKTNDQSWIFDLSVIEIQFKELSADNLKSAWNALANTQKKAGTLWLINLKYNNEKIPINLILDYFIVPKFIETKFAENFKKSLGPKYELLYYFSYTRKFPILVFEVADELTTIPFMRLWDKETMTDDWNRFYLGLSKGKFIRKYLVTKSLDLSGPSRQATAYRVAYRDDDYKLIWLMYNNKMIISSTLSGLQILMNNLRLSE